MNSSTAPTASTAPPTARKEDSRLPSAWDLAALIRPHQPITNAPRTYKATVLPHFPALVEYVYASRYATRSQLQRRFPQWLASDRTARYQLARLVDLGYLATANVNSTAPHFPLVFLATAKGVRLILDTWAQHGVTWTAAGTEESRQRGRSLDSILHELLCTELMLEIHQSVRARPELQLLGVERRYFRRENQLRFTYQTAIRRVEPDAGFMLAVTHPTGNPSHLLHFVEFDNGTMSPKRLLQKYQMYAAWFASKDGKNYLTETYRLFDAQNPRPTFRLLVIAHDKEREGKDERRLLDLYTQALDDSVWPALRDRTWFTTVERLTGQPHDQRPLDVPIWQRARDAKTWIRQYRAEMAAVPRTRGHKLYAYQRKYVAQKMSSLPRHSLFPQRSG